MPPRARRDGPAAFGVVAALLRGRAPSGAVRLREDSESATAFLAFLDRHALTGFVYAHVGETSFADVLPAVLRPALRDAYLRQWAQSEGLISRMAEVGCLLRDAGIDFLFLKGPLFAQRYYGNIDRRLTGDVDLLVRPTDVAAVEALLRSAGFEQDSRLLISRYLAMRFTHHFEYKREGTVVELHWEFANHFTYRIDQQAVWAGRRWIEYRGASYPVPSPEYDLVVQLLTTFKDTELGTIAARSFVDLYQILVALDERLDWSAFFATRAREGLLAISLNMLDLGLEVLGAQEEFPLLTAALARHGSKLVGRERPRKGLELFAATPPAFGNKRRLFRLYDTNLVAAYGWWILSLPWRVAVYQRR